MKEISRELSRQDEYIKYIANDRSFESQINKLYLNLFGRKADFDGLNYWLQMVDQENYHLFRLKFFIKRFAEMKSRGAEYFEINIECVLYIMYTVGYIRVKACQSSLKKFSQVSHG